MASATFVFSHPSHFSGAEPVSDLVDPSRDIGRGGGKSRLANPLLGLDGPF